METTVVYRNYIGIIEKNMETTSWGLGFRVLGLGFGVEGFGSRV